jgi:hypothetical protein
MKKKKAMLFSGWALFISLIAALGVCACIWYASTLGIYESRATHVAFPFGG